MPVSAMMKDDGVRLSTPTFTNQMDDSFLFMVHVALRIQGDMVSHPKPDGIEISEDRATAYVPDILYMCLNLLLWGQQLLEGNVNSEEDDDDDNNDDNHASLRQTTPACVGTSQWCRGELSLGEWPIPTQLLV